VHRVLRGVAWGTRRNDLTAANAAIAKHRLERATEDIKDMFVAGGFKGGNYLLRREHFIVSDGAGRTVGPKSRFAKKFDFSAAIIKQSTVTRGYRNMTHETV